MKMEPQCTTKAGLRKKFIMIKKQERRILRWLSGKESDCQRRMHRFTP